MQNDSILNQESCIRQIITEDSLVDQFNVRHEISLKPNRDAELTSILVIQSDVDPDDFMAWLNRLGIGPHKAKVLTLFEYLLFWDERPYSMVKTFPPGGDAYHLMGIPQLVAAVVYDENHTIICRVINEVV